MQAQADFIHLLLEMRNGAVASDCNRKFNELLDAVFETGAKGEFTVKVSVKPSKRAMGGAVIEVETEHECKTKKPELSVGRSLFFVTQDGRLTRDDPNQEAMFGTREEVSKNVGDSAKR
jgi:hypothetical protein